MARVKKASPLREQKSPSIFSNLSPTTQDVLCVVFLYLVTLVLFRGIVFENKAFSTGGDTKNALTYAKVGNDIKAAEGEDPLWMPNFFSGMPTFGNVHYIPHDVSYVQTVLVAVLKLFYLNGTWSWFPVYYLFCGVFTFLLLRVWNLSRIAALLGAITFMLSPYGIGLAAEGHGSKLMALSYLPLVFLLTHVLFERRDVLSFGLLSAAIGTLLLTNHMQIVYYVFIVLGLYLVYHVVRDFKEHRDLIPKKALLFAGSLVIGLCISSYIYLSVYEYAQFSIRGGGTEGAKGGLTWEYATNWSFHPQELLTLLIPSFFGFSSQYMYNWQGQQVPLPLYWGTMPFNTSSVYIGIVPLLLAVLALVYRRNAKTIFFALLSVIVLLMSFGKHFGIFYELLFTTLPFFNKFRAPAMILHLLAFSVAVLGAFGLQVLLERKEYAQATLTKGLLYALGAIGLVLLLGLVMRSSLVELFGFTFTREGENYGAQVMTQLKNIRFEVLWADYIKFVFIAGTAIGAVLLYVSGRFGETGLSAALIAILVVDLFIIDSKFIDPKPQVELEQSFQPDATVQFLKQQPGLFRVFPLGDLYGETAYAYHGLQSVGGYSPAKLKIYQTVVDSCFFRGPDPAFPLNMNIVNMLNAKYVLAQGQLPADRFRHVFSDQATGVMTYENPSVLPRAWFVQKAVVAQSDAGVFTLLNSREFNPATTAILQKSPAEAIASPGSDASVEVTEYRSRTIKLKARTSVPALMVLSEIYYPAGWKAFVDGQPTEIYRTNSILRSIVVPAGSHEIVFRFDPLMYELGWDLTHAGWGVAALCILIGVWRTPGVRERLFAQKRHAG